MTHWLVITPLTLTLSPADGGVGTGGLCVVFVCTERQIQPRITGVEHVGNPW